MNENLLMRSQDLCVYFPGRTRRSGTVHAVEHVSLDIYRGETLGIVGESGCGKSTLGRSLIRLIEPTGGSILFEGQNISSLKGAALKEMRKNVQIIFQDPSACLNPRRTVKKILMEPFEIHHMTGQMDVNARILELLHLVGMDEYHLSRYPHELPAGRNSASASPGPWPWSRS